MSLNPSSNNNHEIIFKQIYETRKWGGIKAESASGPGSSTKQTIEITKTLPPLFKRLNITSMLDLPCGDFFWMKNINLDNINYTGADIVDDLIITNKLKFGKKNIKFQKLNIVEDNLPKVDLIICRDCLVHFCFEDIFKALRNICKSNSKYLLTTTFTNRMQSRDIETGKWRPLNLELPPIKLPPNLSLILEKCTERNGAYADKSLGLWSIKDIAKHM